MRHLKLHNPNDPPPLKGAMARGHRALEEAFVEGQVCGLRSTLAEAEATTRVKKFQKRKPPELHHLKLHDPNDPPKAHRGLMRLLGADLRY